MIGPQTEVGAVFGVGHAAVADLEHIGIVPVTGVPRSFPDRPANRGRYRLRRRSNNNLQLSHLTRPCQRSLDVAGGAPQVATSFFAPKPRLCMCPRSQMLNTIGRPEASAAPVA